MGDKFQDLTNSVVAALKPQLDSMTRDNALFLARLEVAMAELNQRMAHLEAKGSKTAVKKTTKPATEPMEKDFTTEFKEKYCHKDKTFYESVNKMPELVVVIEGNAQIKTLKKGTKARKEQEALALATFLQANHEGVNAEKFKKIYEDLRKQLLTEPLIVEEHSDGEKA